MIASSARPKLASKVRMRFDRHSQQHMLVYPDKGMLLNPSAAQILQYCTGQHSVAEIVQLLVAATGGEAGQVEADVQSFLGALLERALIRLDD
ncbi:MAG TPA: pyrroloquinoline quinone biosynthesis peptide chaperone PqqD [Polyangiales bacterium]|nr:pyrroloquinoline quinone biosynthesis peptide chaperone PqqD [Polyangiales bacterium]